MATMRGLEGSNPPCSTSQAGFCTTLPSPVAIADEHGFAPRLLHRSLSPDSKKRLANVFKKLIGRQNQRIARISDSERPPGASNPRKKQKRRYACLLGVGVVAIFLTMERSVLCEL
jgi:hypothetical protein